MEGTKQPKLAQGILGLTPMLPGVRLYPAPTDEPGGGDAVS